MRFPLASPIDEVVKVNLVKEFDFIDNHSSRDLVKYLFEVADHKTDRGQINRTLHNRILTIKVTRLSVICFNLVDNDNWYIKVQNPIYSAVRVSKT